MPLLESVHAEDVKRPFQVDSKIILRVICSILASIAWLLQVLRSLPRATSLSYLRLFACLHLGIYLLVVSEGSSCNTLPSLRERYGLVCQ